jgi:DNA processing protein
VGRVSAADERERLARVALSRVAEPGDLRMAGALRELGAVRLHAQLTAQLELLGDVEAASTRLAGVDPALELERAERMGIRFVVPGDDEWPAQLGDLVHPVPVQERGGVPIGLWVRGEACLDELSLGVAVVGSRSATTYGTRVASDVAAAVARSGRTVVSGAAFGIDQAAHRGALAVGEPTVAVLACGVDRPYPAAHADLLRHIADTGAVVSEAAPGCSPTRVRFLSRNRLIAALCSGTVVVEAALRSGALSTANWTDRLGRVLMGVPGPVTSAPSQGVHQLIREGAATLVTSGAEVLELLGASGEHVLPLQREPDRPRDRLDQRQQRVLDAVPVRRPAGVDSIARTAGMGVLEVRTCLLGLADRTLVERRDTGWVLGAGAKG